MSEYKEYDEHSSLYENSDYPSRRQASSRPGSPRQPGGSRKSSAPQPRKRKRKKGGAGRVAGGTFKVLGTLLLVGLCTGALMACFAAVYINQVIFPLADLSMDDFPLNENSIMYYLDKETGEYKEMTTLLSVSKSIWVDYEDMPEYLKQAAVAIEDQRFWTHPGVDWKRTAKAVLSMFTGQDIEGGSTITQQLLKNMTNYNETTVKRKITEIVRALRLTQNNDRKDILERYLNIIPLGYGCEGVGAASMAYFGKPVSQLTLAECASLVSITNNPSKYGPYSFARSKTKSTGELWDARQWNKYRQELVLSEMLRQGMISQAEHDEAVAQELVFVKGEDEATSTQVYTWYEETVIADLKEIMAERFGWSESVSEQALQRGGLRIYTCYDPDAQAAVDEIYTDRSNLNYTSGDGQLMQSAIAVIDNETHDLVAIAGQFGEKTGNLWSNYANSAKRQPGSSFKPLAVYSPAIELNNLSPISVIDDYPYQLMGGKAWPVNNGTTHYRGHVTMEEAIRRSLNTVAVRVMGDYVTPTESFHFLEDRYHIDLEDGRQVGGEWKDDFTLSMALGGLTDGVNVREMAEAYSTFPNGGYYNSSRTFTKVTQMVDGEEKVLLELVPENEQAIKPTTAWYMNSMLQGVFTGIGTASSQGGIRGQHAAGKTGTTSDNNDRWFAGYTPYYTAVVWCGYANPYRVNLDFNPSLRLWRQVMTRLHEGLPDKDFPDPGGQRSITYCMDSGLLATEYCAMDPRGNRTATGRVFPESYPEQKYCPYHTADSVITVCLDSSGDGAGYHRAGEFCPADRQARICFPKYAREQIGTATADDAGWSYERVSSAGTCTVHSTYTPSEPVVPNEPTDEDPPSGQQPDPAEPSGDPSDPSGQEPSIPLAPPPENGDGNGDSG